MHFMKYKYLLFDLDGTLVDTYDAVLGAIQDTLRHHQLPPVERFAHSKGYKDIYKSYMHLVDRAVLRKTHLDMQKNHFHKNTLFPAVQHTLQNLKEKGVRMGLITSGNKPKVMHVITMLEIKDYFEYIVTEHDVENTKPHPEPFEKIFAGMGLGHTDKLHTLMIGDTEADIVGARDFGIDSVAVTYSAYGKDVNMYGPTYSIDSFEQLLPIIFPSHVT